MPDFWSHIYAAKQSLSLHQNIQALGQKSFSLSEKDINYYYFGAQGPDFFYYLRKTRPLTSHKHYSIIAGELHEKPPKKIIQTMLNHYKKHPSSALKAYLAGYITHYLMDVACHPLIESHSATESDHKRIELWYDAAFMQKYASQSIHQMDANLKQTFNCDIRKNIVPLWETITAYDSKILAYAWQDMLIVEDLLIKDTIQKINVGNLLSKVFHFDLSLMAYPRELTANMYQQLDFNHFESAMLNGIEKCVFVLSDFEHVLQGQIDSKSFLSHFDTYNYLGLKGV